MDKIINILIGCILAACFLVVVVTMMLNPTARTMFVHDYVEWLVNVGVLIICITLGVASLIRWGKS